MKINETIGNFLMIGIEGYHLSEEEKDFIIKNNIAGITLFSRNIESRDQVCDLVEELQSLRMHTANKAPLLIAVDEEGGRVSRLKEHITPWPALQNLGKLDSATLTYNFAEAMGHELMAMGINLNFAPCADILTKENNVLIGDRALGSDPDLVGRHASALVRGYLNSNIIACVKHFPGHGNTIVDSHEDLPIEESTWEELEERELQAFKKAFRARVDLAMTAHILFKNIDPEYPVTLSKTFLQKLIKTTGYKKLVISDDLDMKALTKNYDKKDIPVLAVQAGANILLYCNEKESPPQAIEDIIKAHEKGEIPLEVLQNNYNKVVKLKAQKVKQVGPLSKMERDKIIQSKEHLDLANCIANLRMPEGISS